MISRTPPGGWDEFCDQFGSFYHHTSWLSAIAAAFRYDIYFLSTSDSEGLSGILPLALVPGLLGPRRLVSFPFSYATGTLVRSDDAHDELMREAKVLAGECGVKLLEVKQKQARRTVEGFVGVDRYNTYVVTGSDRDTVWSSLHKSSTQRGIKKARKEGVRVETGSSERDWREMSRLQTRTSRKHGVPPPPAKFFTHTCAQLQKEGRCELLRAMTADDALAASAVIWKGTNEWIYAFGASDESRLDVRPIHALLWYSIEKAIEAGVSFDLGRAAPEQASLVQFKERWGGVAQPLRYDYWPEPRGLNSMDRDRGLLNRAAGVASHVPTGAYGFFSMLYRYLG